MASNWPTGVPQAFSADGFSYSAQSGIIRTEMDSGPAKIRRRTTAVPKNFKGNIIMTRAQFETWESWFENTIAFGALTFNITHPWTGATIEVRMVIGKSGNAYSFTNNSALDVVLSIEVEKLP